MSLCPPATLGTRKTWLGRQGSVGTGLIALDESSLWMCGSRSPLHVECGGSWRGGAWGPTSMRGPCGACGVPKAPPNAAQPRGLKCGEIEDRRAKATADLESPLKQVGNHPLHGGQCVRVLNGGDPRGHSLKGLVPGGWDHFLGE